MQILDLSATINVVSLEPSINTYRLGEGTGTYNYNELTNKPSINDVTLQGNIQSSALGIKTSDLTNDSGYISEADIPTATSDLTNDSGFVNATQVQAVVSNAIPSDISYFTNDVGYITDADIGNIPTRTSQLINDSGYITAAEAPVTSVNGLSGTVDLDGTNIEYEQNVSINSKIDAVEASIPTATSELTNDSGFITNANIPTRTSQLVNDSGFVNSQNIPVQSVNGLTGNVVLDADTIPFDSNDSIAEKVNSLTAEDINYDNSSSGLSATDVQGAIDEVKDSALKIANVHSLKDSTTITSSTTYSYTGVRIDIPANCIYSVMATAVYLANSPSRCAITSSSTSGSTLPCSNNESGGHKTVCVNGYASSALSLYVWAQYAGAGANRIDTDGFYIKLE